MGAGENKREKNDTQLLYNVNTVGKECFHK